MNWKDLIIGSHEAFGFLDHLSLKDCNITEISRDFPKHVRELFLNNNNITDKSIPYLISLIKESKALKVIDLRRNFLSEKGAKQIASICKLRGIDFVIKDSSQEALYPDLLVAPPDFVNTCNSSQDFPSEPSEFSEVTRFHSALPAQSEPPLCLFAPPGLSGAASYKSEGSFPFSASHLSHSHNFGVSKDDVVVIDDDTDTAPNRPSNLPLVSTCAADNHDVIVISDDDDEPRCETENSTNPAPKPLRSILRKNDNSCPIPAQDPVVRNQLSSSQTSEGASVVKDSPTALTAALGSVSLNAGEARELKAKRRRTSEEMLIVLNNSEQLAKVGGEWTVSSLGLVRRSGRAVAVALRDTKKKMAAKEAIPQKQFDMRSKKVIMTFRRPRAWPHPRLPWLLPLSALTEPASHRQPPAHVLPTSWVVRSGACDHLSIPNNQQLHLPGGRGRACAACVNLWRSKVDPPTPAYTFVPRSAVEPAGPVVDPRSVERRRHVDLDVLSSGVWAHFMEGLWRPGPQRVEGCPNGEAGGGQVGSIALGAENGEWDDDDGEEEELCLPLEWMEGLGLGRDNDAGAVSDMELENLWEGLVRAAYGMVSRLLELREITDLAHPCLGGQTGRRAFGVFASGRLRPYTVLGSYTGIVREGWRRGESGNGEANYYEMSTEALPAGPWARRRLVVDAARAGNIMGYVNDYRGVADYPNAQYCGCWVNGWPAVVVVATRVVEMGEEVVADYGIKWWHHYNLARAAPHPPAP